LPDHDLGKSVKPNCRNVVRKDEDKHRSFGCPTIRKDIPYKEFKSVADYQVSIFVYILISNCLILYRIMEMSLKQSIYYSHPTMLR